MKPQTPYIKAVKSIFIFAGDPSADIIGADFIKSIKKHYPDIKISGVGGPALKNEGLQSVIKDTDLAHYGIWSVLKNTRLISKQVISIRNALKKFTGDCLITIDMASLSVVLAKDAKKMSLPAYHIVAPTVWAWKSYRAKIFARLYKIIFCIFPFEPKIFSKLGGKAIFIGHPSTMSIMPNYGKRNNELLLLPGSRANEVKELLPLYIKAIKLIPKEKRPVNILITSLPQTINLVKSILKTSDLNISMVPAENRFKAMQKAKLAIVGLGTAGHECGLSAIPQITTYKSDIFTYYFWVIVRPTPFIHVINYMANTKIIPELLQRDCNPKTISKYINNYWNNPQYSKEQLLACEKLVKLLRHHTKGTAGTIVANYISKFLAQS